MFIRRTPLLVSLLCVALSVRAAEEDKVEGERAELWIPVDNSVGVSVAKALKDYAPRGAAPSPFMRGRLARTCPQGWQSYQGNCYQLFKYQYSWNNAEFLCTNVGSNLASAHDVAEYSFLQEMTKNAGFTTAWIGGYKFQNYWKWDDGTPFDYDNWQSQSSSYSHSCLHLNSAGTMGWSTQECNVGKPFICSMQLC